MSAPVPTGRALRVVIAGKMGATPDLAVLLLRPVAQGQTVGLA